MSLGGSSSIGFTLPWSAILGGECDDDRPAQGCDVKIATPQGLDILANDSNYFEREEDPDARALLVIGKRIHAELATLSIESLNTVTNSIIETVNKSSNKSDGRTLALVARLVYEAAVASPRASELYANFSQKIVDEIDPAIRQDTVRNAKSQFITGGRLFRRHIVRLCEQDFGGGLSAAVRAETWLKSIGENPIGEFDSVDDYATMRWIGVFKFVGALFENRLDLLTQHLRHEWLRKYPGDDPRGPTAPSYTDVESLSMLLATVGPYINTPKARLHMKVLLYFLPSLPQRKHANLLVRDLISDINTLSTNGWTVPSKTTLYVDALKQLVEIGTSQIVVPQSPPRLRDLVAASTIPAVEVRQYSTASGFGHSHSPADNGAASAGKTAEIGSVVEHQANNPDPVSPVGPISPPTVAPVEHSSPATGACVPVAVEGMGAADSGIPNGKFSKKQRLKMKKMAHQAKKEQQRAEATPPVTAPSVAVTEETNREQGASGLQTVGMNDKLPQNTLLIPEVGGTPRDPPDPLIIRCAPEALDPIPITPPQSRQSSLPSTSRSDIPMTQPKSPSVPDHLVSDGVAAPSLLEEPIQLQLSAAISSFLSSGDVGAGERALRDLPVEHRWRCIHKIVLAAALRDGLIMARLVGRLIASVASNEICSSESLSLGFSKVVEVLDVVAPHTTDVASRIAIMLKGAHLKDAQLVGLVEQAVGYEREMLLGLLL